MTERRTFFSLVSQEKMLFERKIQLLENKINQASAETIKNCQSCLEKVRSISAFEHKVTILQTRDKEQADVIKSLQKQVTAYETIQRNHETKIIELRKKIKDKEIETHKALV